MKLLIHSNNLNGFTIEVWAWISNFVPHFIIDVIIAGLMDHRSDPKSQDTKLTYLSLSDVVAISSVLIFNTT